MKIKNLVIGAFIATQIFVYGAQEEAINYRANTQWNSGEFIGATDVGIYSYANMEEFMRTSIVDRGENIVDLAENIDDSILATTINGVTFKEHLESTGQVAGFMLVRDGEINYERYLTMEKTDNRVWMSNAKIIAGLGVAMLEEEGKVDVELAIEEYVPSLIGTDWQGVKVINILNMATGLDIAETRESRTNPDSYITKLYKAVTGESGEVYRDVLYDAEKIKEQGEVFEYSSAPTQILGLLIEEVSGQKMADFIEDRMWSKIGAESYAKLSLTPDGIGIIHGVFSSRLVDMAKFGMVFTPSWNIVSDEQIVSNEILETIYTSANKEQFYNGPRGRGWAEDIHGEPIGASYQFDQLFENGDMFKLGLNGQGIYISPENNMVAVWFADGFPADIQTEAYIHQYSRELSNLK